MCNPTEIKSKIRARHFVSGTEIKTSVINVFFLMLDLRLRTFIEPTTFVEYIQSTLLA